METEKTKGTVPRSMIPVPKTFSLQRMSQTQSTDNLSVMSAQPLSKSPTNCRRITRHSSVSRLPTCRPLAVKSRPSMLRSGSGVSNSSFDLTSFNSSNYQTNGIKSKPSTKLFKQNENYVNCQRFQRNHNPIQGQTKPMTGFKIYNKFSPYYENESLDSQTSDNSNQKQSSLDFDCVSNISSQVSGEDSAHISRISIRQTDKRHPGIPYHCQQRSNSRQSMGRRTHSVPEHIQQQFKYKTNGCNATETVNKLLIEKLKTRLIESIDNEDEEQEFDDQNSLDDHRAYEMPQNIEIKLLRIVIRHLREKLNQTKTNSDQINQQMASNKEMCEALQKSLSTMTIRAQHMTQELETKQTELESVCHQLKDKNQEYEDLNRKYQLLDTEYKKLQKLNTNLMNNNINNESHSRTESSLSTMSYGESKIDGSTPAKLRSTSSWLRGSTLSKAFKRRKKLNIFSNSSSDLLSASKESTESVSRLKDLIREKELTISDLKQESLATNNRLERLEDHLKNSREETNNLKKNKDFLEKMIKMQIIE